MISAERPGLRARHVHDAPADARPTFESSSIVKAVRSMDAYPKVQEDYVIGSTAGGISASDAVMSAAPCAPGSAGTAISEDDSPSATSLGRSRAKREHARRRHPKDASARILYKRRRGEKMLNMSCTVVSNDAASF